MFYFISLLLFVFLLRRSLTIITFHGRNMEPTLFVGDRVLRLRLRLRRLLQPGQLVVCQYPHINYHSGLDQWPIAALTGCKPTSTTAKIQPTLSVWPNFPNFTAVVHLIYRQCQARGSRRIVDQSRPTRAWHDRKTKSIVPQYYCGGGGEV